MEGRDIIFIPMSGGMKEIPFWKNLAERWREKIKTLSLSDEIEPEPDDFTDPADEREAFSEESGEEDHLVKTLLMEKKWKRGCGRSFFLSWKRRTEQRWIFLPGKEESTSGW